MSLYDSALVTVKVMTLGPESTMTPLLQYTGSKIQNPKSKIPREAVEEMKIQKEIHIVTIAQSLSN